MNLSIGLLLPSMCIFTLLFVVVSECADDGCTSLGGLNAVSEGVLMIPLP